MKQNIYLLLNSGPSSQFRNWCWL